MMKMINNTVMHALTPWTIEAQWELDYTAAELCLPIVHSFSEN